MSDNTEYITEAMNLLKGIPVVQFEPPSTQIVLDEKGKYHSAETQGWIKLSIAFREEIKKLKGAKLAVFICICLHVNQEGNSWPGVRRICTETGYESAAVTRAAKELSSMGLFRVIRRRGKSNIYRPLFAAYGRDSTPSTPQKRNTVPPKSETVPPIKSETKEEPFKKNQKKELGADKPRREPTESQKELAHLEKVFCELTGLTAPAPRSDKERRASGEMWWQPLTRIIGQANGASDKLLRETVEKMRKDGLTIASPKSVEKVAMALYGEHKHRFEKNTKPEFDPNEAYYEYIKEQKNAARKVSDTPTSA